MFKEDNRSILNDKMYEIIKLPRFKDFRTSFNFWEEVIEDLYNNDELIDENTYDKLLSLYRKTQWVDNINNEFILMVNLIHKILFNK
jgi:hypothetical protein